MEINKLTVATIFLIISLILIFTSVLPKYKQSVLLQGDLFKKQIQYDSRSDYYQKIITLVQETEKRKDVIDKIDSALPADYSLAPVIYFLQKKSNENGMITTSIVFLKESNLLSSPTTTTAGQSIKEINFAISLSGTYQNLKNFLAVLDRSARLFEVDKISFALPGFSQRMSSALNQNTVYDFKINVKTHSY